MATYVELFSLVDNATFQQRVRVAMWRAATDVLNEADSVDAHKTRMLLARKLMTDAVQTPPRLFVIVLLQNPTIFTGGAASSDNDLQFAVNTFFTAFARMEERYGN
jgi:hypothetical protein